MPPHCRNKKREYLEGEYNEVEADNKNKIHLYTNINGFMQGYQPRNEG
jgi:hypothetical protein